MSSAEIDSLNFSVKPVSLGDKVADIIRDKIINGEYTAGMRLTEDGFAKVFGISRPCVKEAFLILQSEGLVIRRVKNKYTEVVAFSKQDIAEIISIRAAIEILCAETSIINNTVPAAELESKIKSLACMRDEGMPLKEHVLADLDFHRVIVVSSGNKRALDIWNNLETQMKTLLLSIQHMFPDEAIKTVDVHSQLLNALVSGDISNTRAALDEHIMTNISFIQKSYEKRFE